MAWRIEYLEGARKTLRKLDHKVARRIVDFMDERVAVAENPRSLAVALIGVPEKLWRYRVGDYRVICEIRDGELVVLVIEIGHRSDIYR